MRATQPIGCAQGSPPPCHQELVLTDFPSLAPTSPMPLPGFTSQVNCWGWNPSSGALGRGLLLKRTWLNFCNSQPPCPQEAVVLSSQSRTGYPTPRLPWKASGAPVSALFQVGWRVLIASVGRPEVPKRPEDAGKWQTFFFFFSLLTLCYHGDTWFHQNITLLKP